MSSNNIIIDLRESVKEEYLVIILGQFLSSLHKNICCGYSLEPYQQGTSNEYPKHLLLWRNGESSPRIIIRYSSLTSPPCYKSNHYTARQWLTLVLLNPDMPCLCKQYRSRSVGF